MGSAGFHVLSTADVQEAITIAKKFNPRVIIIDVLARSTSGAEAPHILKHDPATSRLPVIVISNLPESSVQRLVREGTSYLHKEKLTPQLDEKDWLVTLVFFSNDGPDRYADEAEKIGYLFGYAQMIDTRMLALVGDAESGVYEPLSSFSSVEMKRFFRPHKLEPDHGDSGKRLYRAVPIGNSACTATRIGVACGRGRTGHFFRHLFGCGN